ncbi:MAG: hypothetical protein O9284_04980 [Steroidobacteraceae bacterium]|jgi:thiopurine S-methyltransferase|nr:hypothetical protein [Steroidobacteraceae bacterium]
MDPEFWLERWRTGRTGWHQAAPHPFLTQGLFDDALAPGAGAASAADDARMGADTRTVDSGNGFGIRAARPRVFVPLCGASVDMAWLRTRGYEVVGLDLSADALRAFLDERGLAPRIERVGAFERFVAPGFELYAGDFFAADPQLLGRFGAVYDRAALVALPAALRDRYARTLAALCATATRVALVAFEYDPARASGPPFPVWPDEIERLYSTAFEIRCVARVDVLADNPRLRERGLEALHETGYVLVKRP